MSDQPEREQADTSFDTLYHLAKKLEARHQPHNMTTGGTSTHGPTRVTRSIPPLEDAQLLWKQICSH